jgi:hypothetical protein
MAEYLTSSVKLKHLSEFGRLFLAVLELGENHELICEKLRIARPKQSHGRFGWNSLGNITTM